MYILSVARSPTPVGAQQPCVAPTRSTRASPREPATSPRTFSLAKMKVFSFPFLSPILCHGLRHPVPPTLKLLFSANLTLGIPVDVGLTTFGEKLIVPITDGAFSGPGLNGEVTIGLVTSLTGSQGTQRADLRPTDQRRG
ncbi:hypothetical protein GMDG_04620 [Pseudogymnoascus destructans 20631-21]|uniref:Uncharacterized protein n=1 Tax=Pseudogymnoascus destructans (strain ATCC MYA-4855 / 20631-21) TaxID=658429 RepID=L8GAY5_PSED2|nr:hypothetical protein GMDG_04620 [Pseudogymnoascus destructans 20631-21]